MSRRMFVSGKSAAVFLGLAIAWNALGTTFSGTDFPSTSRAEENNLVQELVVLEFIEKDVPQCEKTNALIGEMKRKNYPIQLVERTTGGDVLFEQYAVETTPTFVFLVDGKESKRLVVKDESVKDVRDRLLSLFRECRNEASKVDKTSTVRGQVSELERFATSGAQTDSRPEYGRTVPVPSRRGSLTSTNASTQANAGGAASGFSDYSQNAAGLQGTESSVSRPGLTQIRAFVEIRGTNEERIGAGVVVHYNEEYGEALTLVPATLFAGVSDPTSMTNTTLDVFSTNSESRERVVGQCVFCDAQAGIAFVAARVASPVAPVAFLAQNEVPQAGESAFVATFNNNNEFVPEQCEILNCELGTFRLSSGDGQDRRGSGIFLERAGRLYFAGLYTSKDAENNGVVVSLASINQILLSNSNLSTVYRDQVSGRYEPLSLASFGTQFSSPLLNSTARVDLNEVAPSTNMSDVFKSADVESNVLNALSKLPNRDENAPNDPSLQLNSPDAPTIDAAPVFANSDKSTQEQTAFSDVPSVLKKNLNSGTNDVAGKASGTRIPNAYERSIALATNENQALDPRAQEIPNASREIDGSFTDANDIRSTNYASRQNDRAQAINDQETVLFESSLDELRRLSLEGAEIICIVNWGSSSGETRARETEVVRLPRRKSAVAPNANPGASSLSFDKSSSSRIATERKVASPDVPQPQTTMTTGVSDMGFLR